MKRVLATGFVLLLALANVPTPALAIDATTLQYWPTSQPQVGEGFHLRVPVTVHNQFDQPIRNGVVLAELDLRQRLIDAGWVSEARGAGDVLQSFDLDQDSIRVVEMTNFNPPSSGGTSGLLRAYDTRRDPSDPRRYEIPSIHFEGLLSDEGQITFDPKTNPTLTVMWRVPGQMGPGDQRFFVVYFDSLTNTDHEPSDSSALLGGTLLDRAFWNGPGTDLVGFVAPRDGQPGQITVIGLSANTEVAVLIANAGGTFAPQPPTGVDSNPFNLQANEVKDVFISDTFGTAFRLVSDKPILALVESEGFVPTLAGEIVGTEFHFATTYSGPASQDSLFVYNRHPNNAGTVVELTDIVTNAVKTIHLSDPSNQFPYTMGAHATDPRPEGTGCVFPESDETVVLPPGPHKYRARVVSGGPISIQLQPFQGITPVPAWDQGPRGSEHWTALSRSSAVLRNGACGLNLQQYATYATSLEESRLELRWLDANTRLDPPCTPQNCPPGTLIGPGPETTLDGRTFNTGDITDQPLRFAFSAPSWLFVAPSLSPSLAQAAMRGPLGGASGGREFAGLGPTSLYAPYANTKVEAQVEYSLSGIVETTFDLAAERIVSLPERGATDRILWYTLSASRPIVALPRGAAPGFLGGIPAVLESVVHDVDFRGHLIEIRSPTGLNPVTASTVPGQPALYTFEVTNLGRGAAGATLSDTVELDVGQVPTGWVAALSRTAIRLNTGETEEVVLSVTPPADAPPGALGQLTVTAASRGNPKVFDTTDSVTRIKRSFDIGIWFDQIDGPKAVEEDVAQGETTDFAVVVQNRGTVRDVVGLSFTNPDAGWTVELLQDGTRIDGIALESLEVANLVLRVTPPVGVAEGVLFTTVDARSLSSPSVVDRIAATTKLRAPSFLTLSTDNDTVWVMPGEAAIFNLTVRNEGLGTTEVILEQQTGFLAGWTRPKIVLRSALGDDAPELSRISLSPGQELPLSVVTNASEWALGGQRRSIRFAASSASDASAVDDFLTAIVLAKHDLRATFPGGVAFDHGGENKSVEIRLENKGNLRETFRISTGSVPAGWKLHPSTRELIVPRNGTQVLRAWIVPASIAEVGSYNVTLDLTSHDGNRTRIKLVATIGIFTADTIDGVAVLEGQPGRTASHAFEFQNLGNTPVKVDLEPTPGEAWRIDLLADPVIVPAGANASIPVRWHIPVTAGSGLTRHTATLHVDPEGSGTSPYTRAFESDIIVGRPNLRVLDVRTFPGPAGTLVHVTIANDGQRPAYDVAVVLESGEEIVDSIALGTVGAGDRLNVTMLWPSSARGPVMVVIDPEGTVTESDRADNTHEVQTIAAAEAAEVPAVAPIAAIAVAMLLALVRRTRG